MSTCKQWLQLDVTEFQSEGEEVINGRIFHVSVSPYDVPREIGLGLDCDHHTAKLEFRYLSAERTEATKLKNGATVFLGVHSGRLYAISIKELSESSDSFLDGFQKAIDGLTTLSGRPQRISKSIELAKRAISQKGKEMFERRTSLLTNHADA